MTLCTLLIMGSDSKLHCAVQSGALMLVLCPVIVLV